MNLQIARQYAEKHTLAIDHKKLLPATKSENAAALTH